MNTKLKALLFTALVYALMVGSALAADMVTYIR